MPVVVSPELSKRQLGDVELFTFGNRLLQVLFLSQVHLLVEGTHVEEDAALVRRHVANVNVCALLSHRFWVDTSAEIKPCFCEGVFGGSSQDTHE